MLKNMQKKLTIPWYYGLMAWIMAIVKKLNFRHKSATQSPITYHSHSTLTVADFIECYVEDNLQLLVINGDASKLELQEYWQTFLLVYFEKLGSIETRNFFNLNKQLEIKQMSLYILEQSLMAYLRYRPLSRAEKSITDLKKLISKLGFHFEKSLNNTQILKLYDTFSKSQSIELQTLQLRIDEQNKNKGELIKPGREKFIETIVVMAKNGFHVKLTDTVEFYCTTVKLYNGFCNEQEKAFKKANKK